MCYFYYNMVVFGECAMNICYKMRCLSSYLIFKQKSPSGKKRNFKDVKNPVALFLLEMKLFCHWQTKRNQNHKLYLNNC